MKLAAVLAALALPMATFSIACSSATGTTSGGDARFDGGAPPAPTTVQSCAKDGGATWTDLYRDCFGPSEASCSTGTCHDSSLSSGGKSWVCGPTKDSCWTGIQTIAKDNVDPTMTSLYTSLRTMPGQVTYMPRSSTFTFAPEDLARIRTWIANGAKND